MGVFLIIVGFIGWIICLFSYIPVWWVDWIVPHWRIILVTWFFGLLIKIGTAMEE